MRRSVGVKAQRQVAQALAAVACLMVTTPRAAYANDAATQSTPTEPSATAARAALQTLLEQLVSTDENMRRAAARAVEALGSEATPAMADELARLRPGRPVTEVTALLARARNAPDAGDGLDRLNGVLNLRPETSGPAYAQTVVTLCLIRSLALTATPDAVATFAPVALDAHGAFAADVTRHLTALGERATAGLVLMTRGRSAGASRWATSELELLGTRTPGDAVQTKSKEVLAEVLTAYGTVHDPDALSVVMSFINADRRLVRDAARSALAGYGDLAVPRLRESYGLLLGEAAPPDGSASWLRKNLFEALDRVRLEDVDARVRAGEALAEAGNFAQAVSDFDDVLARQPDWNRKSELVPAYVFDAKSLVSTDPKGAASLFEKALALDPQGPRSAQIKAALAVIEGTSLVARGIEDEEPFRRALTLDPGNAAATAQLLRMADQTRERKQLWKQRFVEACSALALLSALVLFAGPRRRTRRS
jgi:hypothetical protein